MTDNMKRYSAWTSPGYPVGTGVTPFFDGTYPSCAWTGVAGAGLPASTHPYVHACPECGTIPGCIHVPDCPADVSRGVDVFQPGTREAGDVPFPTQEWMFESLAELELEHLHDLIDDYHDRIIEMARDRFRKGFAKYGDRMYRWAPEDRLEEALQELADAVVYLTSGSIE